MTTIQNVETPVIWMEILRRAEAMRDYRCYSCGKDLRTGLLEDCQAGVGHSLLSDDAIVFLAEVYRELRRAHVKFPEPDGTIAALAEEVGELAKAYLQESLTNVYKEAVQVATVALRVATEGDPTLDKIRGRRGL